MHPDQLYHPLVTSSSRRNNTSKVSSSLGLSNADAHYSPYPNLKSNGNNGNDTSNAQSQLPSFHRTPTVSLSLRFLTID